MESLSLVSIPIGCHCSCHRRCHYVRWYTNSSVLKFRWHPAQHALPANRPKKSALDGFPCTRPWQIAGRSISLSGAGLRLASDTDSEARPREILRTARSTAVPLGFGSGFCLRAFGFLLALGLGLMVF